MKAKARAALGPSGGRVKLLLSATLVCLTVAAAGGWYAARSQALGRAAVKERIGRIISETLRSGEREVDGVKIFFRVMPSAEALEEVKQCGDEAVPVLAGYFDSENPAERNLALRLLASLGGSRIVKPLREAILYHPSPDFRQSALRWATQAPWREMEPAVRAAADSDPAPGVRDTAREVLDSHPRR